MLRKLLGSACVFAVLASAMSGTAYAQGPADYRTIFTFSQPVTLPGVTLPAGKYLFRLTDVNGSRRVVQILSEDATQSYAMLLAIPAQRLEPPAEPEVRFMETAANAPSAIKTWWYPGSAIGWEFIYPKDQAIRLAKAATQPVLTTTQTADATTEEMKTADLSRVSDTGEQTAVTREDTPVASAPAGETQEGERASSTLSIPAFPVPVAAGSGTTALTRTETTSPQTNLDGVTVAGKSRTSLPQTASPQPTILLLGVAATCAGISLWYGPRFRV